MRKFITVLALCAIGTAASIAPAYADGWSNCSGGCSGGGGDRQVDEPSALLLLLPVAAYIAARTRKRTS